MTAVPDSIFAGLKLEEKEGGYPDAGNFLVDGLPAHGFFVRHAKNIQFENVKITPDSIDGRPCFSSGINSENITIDGKSVNPQKVIDFSFTPEYIKNIKTKDTTVVAKVMKFRMGSQLLSDRSTVISKKNEILDNAEYIYWPNKLRDSNLEEFLTFETVVPGTIYVAHDAKYKQPDWLKTNFESTGIPFEMGKLKFLLYKKVMANAQKVVLGSNQSGTPIVSNGSNYIVFFVAEKR
jgi:hypothetical protein